MKKKIVCILVCMLMIITTASSVTGNINIKRITKEIIENNTELIKAKDFNEQNPKPSFVTPAWYERQKLNSSDGGNFGCSVSIQGDYCIIGSKSEDDGKGSVYIFMHDGTSWTEQQKLTASDGVADDNFGASVSIDGEYAIVGAYGDEDDGWRTGAAYIFKRTGTSWGQPQKLTALDYAGGDWFGLSVSIDGEYAIVGAEGNDDDGIDSGSAYIFKRDGTTWTQQQKLTATDATGDSYFGNTVSIDGDYAVIGAYLNDNVGVNSGAAYVFKDDGQTWTQQLKLIASDAAEYDFFGRSVSIDGDYIIVGADGNDDPGGSSGSAYIFKGDGVTWTEEKILTASDSVGGEIFGNSVSIDNDYALIASRHDDSRKGSAYIFKHDGTSWTEQQKLIASDGMADDEFGYSVSINGDYAVVGAIYNDASKGATYIFSGPLPDLLCCGCLCWYNVEPGETLTGEFQVYNIGEPGSELNWVEESKLSWGTWTFNPISGTGLTPEMSPITVDVEVIAPEGGIEYTGEVIIKNRDDGNDICKVDASLTIEDTTPPTVKIERPVRGRYFLNMEIRKFLLPRITQIFGDIKIIVNATDEESGIKEVKFYAGLFGNEYLGNATTEPYNITWEKQRIFRFIHIHQLTVIAYNNAGLHKSTKILVRKIL